MRVLLLCAYAAGSHLQWREVLCEMLPDWSFEVLELPARHFSWRMRGNALYWSSAERQALESGYDVLLATSTVDLATLRGLVPALTRLPTIVYCHENQFAYPDRAGQQGLVEMQVTSVYTGLAADALVFNSQYNFDSFIAGAAELLGKLPDFVPPGVVERLTAKSEVLPVPLQPVAGAVRQRTPGPLRLQWVGRFEYDKGGELLAAILAQLERLDLDYELAVTGQQFRRCPAVFDAIRETYAHRLVQFGYETSRQDYLAQLARADIVLSTAWQEFQGLAVMEAVQRGACPVVPDRLAYPEIYPAACRYPDVPDDAQAEAAGAAQLIVRTARVLRKQRQPCPDLAAFEVPALEPRYRALFEAVRARQGNS
ncbi:MAG: DUF3524 domain-containing protein [Halioglobus sp.]|nr:DUF3524 domain-containing protein [Halioglobus sp.]